MKYWLMAPWENNDKYDEVVKFDVENHTIALGWTELGDLSGMSHDAILERYKQSLSNEGRTEKQTQLDVADLDDYYNNVQPGDVILVRRGVKEIVAEFTVTQKAWFDDALGKKRGFDGKTYYAHFLRGNWTMFTPPKTTAIRMESRAFRDISEEQYQRLINGQPFNDKISKTNVNDARSLISDGHVEDNNVDLSDKLEKIFSKYNDVHTDQSARPDVSELFNSFKDIVVKQLEVRGTRDITSRWSYPKPSWAFIPWVAFLDKNDEQGISSGIYCCVLFRSDMKGLYLTLIQGVNKYKDDSKQNRIRNLQQNKENIRKKLNYLNNFGFSLDDNIDLKAPPGSSGEDYDKAVVLYKYFSRGGLPDSSILLSNIQMIIDAYRAYASQEDRQPDSGIVQADIETKITFRKDEEQGNFLDYLSREGFSFDPNLVISFLLSLKVKPFIILTGPSGCGKTKLAQLFAQYLSERDTVNKKDYIVTDVKVGKSANHEGWTFPRTQFFNYYPDLVKYQGQYEIEVDGIKGQGNLELLTRLFFKQNNNIKKRLEELAKVDPSRRITLKIFIPQGKSSKYEIIPVGANWTESRHIVGFYNVITREYQRTKALDLILAAGTTESQRTPFFLILDEMNLSHVERYFADFLSAIESGEAIPLHRDKNVTEIPSDITLSPNLEIIGTVNVDETTYMFSPKVLDRANTIEVLTGSMLDYMNDRKNHIEISGDIRYLENIMDDALEIRSLTIEQIREHFNGVMVGDNSFWNSYSQEIDKFQQCLKDSGLDFGFRVVNEISRFLLAAWRFEGEQKQWNNWYHYFDMQIKQKMLPKIHGSERSLGRLLEGMFQLCFGENTSKAPREYSFLEVREKALYVTSALKLKEMDSMLYNQRYVSFTR